MRTNFLRDRAASVLAGAERALRQLQLEGLALGRLMRVMFKFQRVEIYDSTGHTKTKHERLRRHRVRTRRWMVNLRRHLSRTAPPCATFPTRP